MNTDASAVLVDGPWEHRFISANGARFHAAEIGEGPLVVLLHGFPQFWWTWRHQLVALAEAGYRAVAPDLRGFGASDKPPSGYDVPTAAKDVCGIIRSLGEDCAVVVGHGLGGAVAWTLPYSDRDVVWAFGSIGMPHPATLHHGPWRARIDPRRLLTGQFAGLPRLAERDLAADPGAVHRLLSLGASPHLDWPGREESSRYAEAMTIPFAAHSAVEAHQWLMTAAVRRDGRAYLRSMRSTVDLPALLIRGADDPTGSPATLHESIAYAPARATVHEVTGAGHFPHEEQPEAVSTAMLGWLDTLT